MNRFGLISAAEIDQSQIKQSTDRQMALLSPWLSLHLEATLYVVYGFYCSSLNQSNPAFDVILKNSSLFCKTFLRKYFQIYEDFHSLENLRSTKFQRAFGLDRVQSTASILGGYFDIYCPTY